MKDKEKNTVKLHLESVWHPISHHGSLYITLTSHHTDNPSVWVWMCVCGGVFQYWFIDLSKVFYTLCWELFQNFITNESSQGCWAPSVWQTGMEKHLRLLSATPHHISPPTRWSDRLLTLTTLIWNKDTSSLREIYWVWWDWVFKHMNDKIFIFIKHLAAISVVPLVYLV